MSNQYIAFSLFLSSHCRSWRHRGRRRRTKGVSVSPFASHLRGEWRRKRKTPKRNTTDGTWWWKSFLLCSTNYSFFSFPISFLRLCSLYGLRLYSGSQCMDIVLSLCVVRAKHTYKLRLLRPPCALFISTAYILLYSHIHKKAMIFTWSGHCACSMGTIVWRSLNDMKTKLKHRKEKFRCVPGACVPCTVYRSTFSSFCLPNWAFSICEEKTKFMSGARAGWVVWRVNKIYSVIYNTYSAYLHKWVFERRRIYK